MKKISYLSLCILCGIHNQLAVAQDKQEHLELEQISVHGVTDNRQGSLLSGRLASSEKLLSRFF